MGARDCGSPPHRSQIPFVCRCRVWVWVWVKGAESSAAETERWICRQHIEVCGRTVVENARRIQYGDPESRWW